MSMQTLHDAIELLLMPFGIELKISSEQPMMVTYEAIFPTETSSIKPEPDDFTILLDGFTNKAVLMDMLGKVMSVDIDVYDPTSKRDIALFVGSMRMQAGTTCTRCDGCGKVSSVDGRPWSALVGNDDEATSVTVDGVTAVPRECNKCQGFGRRRTDEDDNDGTI
jgi:hypothetical protein